ncbi:ash family protein [Buttiauxella agrestis]|nr:ash family protein [Buttiauxella agrestis]
MSPHTCWMHSSKTVLTTSMVAQAGQPSGWPVSL